jgi:choline dehydrogenase
MYVFTVDPGYLSDPRDTAILRNGLATARRVVQQARSSGFPSLEVLPGALFNYTRDAASFSLFAGLCSTTYYHACGTCRMVSTEQATPIAPTSPSEAGAGYTAPTPTTATNAAVAAAVVEEKEEKRGGVVDTELRVLGVQGLRIADASVIPAISSSPIQAVCMVIGERCGKLILASNSVKNSSSGSCQS